jgi:hypothetical protein
MRKKGQKMPMILLLSFAGGKAAGVAGHVGAGVCRFFYLFLRRLEKNTKKKMKTPKIKLPKKRNIARIVIPPLGLIYDIRPLPRFYYAA